MKRDYFVYRVEMEIEVTRAEHTELVELANHHYDYKCQSLAKQGGMLYGWGNMFEARKPTETIKVKVTWGDLDTLCKVTEASEASGSLVVDLRRLFRELREETHRITEANRGGGG